MHSKYKGVSGIIVDKKVPTFPGLKPYDVQVLGMPANFTVNPRTGIIDYIQVHPELLSLAAFKQGVKSTVVNSAEGDIQIVIPAYLNEDHFHRALPLMPGVLRVCLEDLFYKGNT